MTDRGTEYLAGRGITPDTAKRFGLVYDAERDAVAIPYVSALGDIVMVRLRMLAENAPHKYDQAPGSKPHLFNVVDCDTAGVYICEGELDAVILKQLGKAAVGVSGTHGFKDEWRWLFHGNPHVRIIYDGDDAGVEAGKALRRLLSRHVDRVEVVSMPPGQDVTDCFMAGHLEEVLKG